MFLDSAEAVAVGLCSDELAWCFGGTRFGLHRVGAHDADTAAVAHGRSTAALLDSPNSQNHDMCHDVRGSSWTMQPARPGGCGTVGPAASAGDLRLRGEGVGNGLWGHAWRAVRCVFPPGPHGLDGAAGGRQPPALPYVGVGAASRAPP